LFSEAAIVFGFSSVRFGFGGGGHCLIEVRWSMERCVVELLECESSFCMPGEMPLSVCFSGGSVFGFVVRGKVFWIEGGDDCSMEVE